MKHFNSGNIWGRVLEAKAEKSEKGTSYISLLIECPNEKYGPVKVYGRLWNQDKINKFNEAYKTNPGAIFRFRGFFNQYEKDGKVNSNYTLYDWQITSGLVHEETPLRAAFVIVGTISKAEKIEEEGKICVKCLREGRDGYADVEENFELWIQTGKDCEDYQPGDLVEIKGLLRTKDPEDFFGAPGGIIRPYIQYIVQRNPEG